MPPPYLRPVGFRHAVAKLRRLLPGGSDSNILGRFYVKEVDVVVSDWRRGPDVLISTKTQFSSYLKGAWRLLARQRLNLDAALQRGEWWTVVAEVDRVLLKKVMGLDVDQVGAIRDAAAVLRVRRTRQTERNGSAEA